MPDEQTTTNEQQTGTTNETPTTGEQAAIQQSGETGTNTNSSSNTADDLSALFTPGEVAAKKETLAAAKAEEERRASLTDEQRTAEDTQKQADAKANEIPEEYSFKMPEGMELDTEVLAKVAPIFKEAGLSQAKADKMVEVYTKEILPAFAKRQADAWKAETDSWAEATRKDPEIGGVKFDETVKNAQRAVNTINPALKEVFDKYGLGNHPEFVRTFAKIATLLKEDTIDKGGMASDEKTGEARYTDAFYKKG